MTYPRPPSPAGSTSSTDSFRSARSFSQPDDAHPQFTDSEIRALLDEASLLKDEGNALFRAQKWEEAKQKYEEALRTAPRREGPLPKPSPLGEDGEEEEGVPEWVDPPVPTVEEEEVEEEDEPVEEILTPAASAQAATSHSTPNGSSSSTTSTSNSKDKGKGKAHSRPKTSPEPPLRKEARLLRSVLNNNLAACLLHLSPSSSPSSPERLDQLKLAIDYCTRSLEDDPGYIKALWRRAQAGREVGGWAGLSKVKEDLQKLLQILPPDSPLLPQVRSTLRQVEPELEKAAQKEKDEMLSKLKDLGNTFLGKFGLSTDNFKFEPDGKGGYSMGFQR